jgi:hypothetical protein
LAIFFDTRLDEFLVDYSIGRNPEEIAVELIGLISETLPEFRDWLAELGRGKNLFPFAAGNKPAARGAVFESAASEGSEKRKKQP